MVGPPRTFSAHWQSSTLVGLFRDDFALTALSALLPKPSQYRLDPAEDFLRLGGGNPWRLIPGLAFASVPGPRGFLARKTSTANRLARLFSKILLAPAACQNKCVVDRGFQLFVDVKVVPGGLVSSRAFWLALERIAGEKMPGTQCSHRVHRRLLVDRSGRRRAFLRGSTLSKAEPVDSVSLCPPTTRTVRIPRRGTSYPLSRLSCTVLGARTAR